MPPGGEGDTGHTIRVPLAAEAEPPITWTCRQHGTEADLSLGTTSPPRPKRPTPRKSHLQHLYERRSPAELEVLVNERLAQLRGDRK